jgi:uncharacterized protein YfiM (DUF2279 family)
MNMGRNKMKMKITQALLALSAAALMTACGDDDHHYSNGSPVYYPYETVYGDVCSNTAGTGPTPGCTFNRDGSRVVVSQDLDYNYYGYGSDDLWYVHFYSDGTADVYNDLGVYQYTTNTSNFAGWVGGNTIGVGTTGLFWENVAGGVYWLGRNGVLYDANYGEANYGEAINTKESQEASDTNFAAISTETNKAIVKMGAAKLVKDYGFKAEKAEAVASALNSWAVAAAERGYTTEKDMDRTFKAVFGVEFSSALAAVKDLQGGEKDKMRELTNRTASALGLSPHEAQKFLKGMYSKALADWGYDMNNVSW